MDEESKQFTAFTLDSMGLYKCICEMLDSLVGSAYYSTFDLTSGFWQVPMDEESKQFTAFTLGSMGLYKCICEMLDSLVGSAYYSTFDLTSGF